MVTTYSPEGAALDTLTGGNGDDALAGGDDDDTLDGSNGDDNSRWRRRSYTVNGERGNDVAVYVASENIGDSGLL